MSFSAVFYFTIIPLLLQPFPAYHKQKPELEMLKFLEVLSYTDGFPVRFVWYFVCKYLRQSEVLNSNKKLITFSVNPTL